MKGRHGFACAAALLVFGAAVGAVGATPGRAEAAAADPYQAIAVSTTPAGGVPVGQSFSLDVHWSNLTVFPTYAFWIDVSVPPAFRVDAPVPSGCSVDSVTKSVRCAIPGTAAQHVDLRLSLTALVEAYDQQLGATASSEIGSVSAAVVLDVYRPGIVADVHPMAVTAPAALFVGDAVTMATSVANGGTTTMQGVVATVDVGAGLRLDGATWGPNRTPCARAGTRATCTIATMGARSAVPLSVDVTPVTPAAISTTTFAVTTMSPQQQPDPAPDTVTVVRAVAAAVADLGVALQLRTAAPVVGAYLDATIVVTNHGPASAKGVEATYTVPAQYEILAMQSYGHSSCEATGQVVRCRLVDGFGADRALAAGGTESIQVRLTPKAMTAGTIVGDVTSSVAEPNPDPSADHATLALPGAASAAADLQLVRWTAASPVVTGAPTTSSLLFTNAGPSRSRGLKAVIGFPAGWTITAVQDNVGGTCTRAGRMATCLLGELTGGVVSLDVTAVPTVVGAGQVVTATMTTSYPDPDGPLQASLTYDVLAAPMLTIDPPVSVPEGSTALLGLHLSPASTKTVSVDCITGGWTATGGTDYVETTRTITFVPGATASVFAVETAPDGLDEADVEVVLVACGNARNAALGAPDPVLGLMWTGVGITDDDPRPTLVPGGTFQAEGASSTAVVPITLSAPSGRPVTATWRTVDDDAVAPGDYTAASGTVTFQPGETTKTVAVTVRDDSIREPDEWCYLAFTNVQNADLGGLFGLGLIELINDD